MSMCNLCHLQSIEAGARLKGLSVTCKDRPLGGAFPAGVDILVHPPDIEPDKDEHFVVWFASIPSHCAC